MDKVVLDKDEVDDADWGFICGCCCRWSGVELNGWERSGVPLVDVGVDANGVGVADKAGVIDADVDGDEDKCCCC